MSKAEVARREETNIVPAGADSIIAVISRAASDPTVNVEKLEKLLDMYERVQANQAKVAFDDALAKLQPDLPIVDKRGKITIREKNSEKVIQSTPYALWEDINETIKPILADHGFSLRFRTGTAEDGKLTVTAILGHRDGHREETTIPLMHDGTGSKNAVQAVGSSLSYGKRYAATAILNITTKGEDDDGKLGGAKVIDQKQLARLIELADDVGADKAKFCTFMGVNALAEIPAKDFDRAVQALNDKRKGAKS